MHSRELHPTPRGEVQIAKIKRYNDSGLPYQKHSETSKQAAQQNTTARSVRDQALFCIQESAGTGMTAFEIAVKLNKIPNVMSSRVKELEDRGMVIRTAITRKTGNNCNANVFVFKSYYHDGMGRAPIKTKTVSIDDEIRLFIKGIKCHVERYNGMSIHKDGAVHRQITELCKKIK